MCNAKPAVKQAADATNASTPASTSAVAEGEESKAQGRSDAGKLAAQGELAGGGARSNAASRETTDERADRGTASIDAVPCSTKGDKEEGGGNDASGVDGGVTRGSDTTGEIEERAGSDNNGGGGCKSVKPVGARDYDHV